MLRRKDRSCIARIKRSRCFVAKIAPRYYEQRTLLKNNSQHYKQIWLAIVNDRVYRLCACSSDCHLYLIYCVELDAQCQVYRREFLMKHISAILTAVIITTVIGLGILVVGVSALTNTNTVALQNSPSSIITGNNLTKTGGNTSGSSPSSSSDGQQLQQQVSDLQAQLNQASQIIQQYQSLLLVLQQRGVIVIDRSGNIYLPQGSSTTFH